jgi:NAD+ kinase
MKKIGIFIKKGAPEALDVVNDLLLCLKEKRLKFFIEEEAASSLGIKGVQGRLIPSKVDMIVVFGGDGTILSVARLVGSRSVPILGVNLGGLGFITEISKDEVCGGMNNILSGKYSFEERIMLIADVYRNGKKLKQHNALNDIVLHKSALARMIELDIHINNKYVTTFKADGLIISTPTGSTAHSLSAGGPILYPTLESFLMTPICPHTLTSRPIVLPDAFTLDISVKKGDDVYLTLDGQEGLPLKVNDKVKIKKADYKTRFLHLHDRDYFKVLRTKLNWGKR